MPSPLEMLNTLVRQVRRAWIARKVDEAVADAMQRLDRRSRKIVWAALNNESQWVITRRYWVHRPSNLAFWIAKGRAFFKVFKRPHPDAPPVMLPDIAMEHLWRAFELQRDKALAKHGWKPEDKGASLAKRLADDTEDLAKWTVTREMWTHKPTGISFWIGNGESHFECLARNDINAAQVPFSEKQMRDLWLAYGRFLKRLLQATGG